MKKFVTKLSVLLSIFYFTGSYSFAAIQLTPIDISKRPPTVTEKNVSYKTEKNENKFVVPYEGILTQSSFKISGINPTLDSNFTGNFILEVEVQINS